MLTISNVTYDETGLIDVDSDSDNNVASLSTALTNQISAVSLSGFYTGANAVTQYAELANFVSSDQAVTNYSLASDSSGHAFSTSTGIASNLYVGSNEVFLYGTSDPNVVVGRLGSGTTADAGGNIVMLIALNETKDGTGHVTGTDLGVAMYAPLVNSNGSAVDDADTLNLSGLVNIYSTYSTVTVVPFNDFSKVPSGQDAFALIGSSDPTQTAVDLLATGFAGSTEGTVNVSTTGLGANNQTVDNGASLRIDIVTANAQDFAKADTSPEVHDANNIGYESHVEAIAGGFELTQNNPTNKLASLTVSAYDGAANNIGANFVSHIFSDGSTLVQIDPSQVHVTDASGNPITGITVTQSGDGKSVLITGVPALAHIDFTSAGQFDRFIVTNTMTGTNDKTTFDVGGIHVSTITGGHGSESADLGSHLIFEDGGPSFGANGTTIPTVTVDEDTLGASGAKSGDFSGLFNVNYGPDGAGSLAYALGVSSSGANSTLVDTATGNGIFLYMDGSDVVGRVGSGVNTANASGAVDFRISVDSSGNVRFEQDHAVVHSDPNAADESAGMTLASLVTLTATATDSDGDSTPSQAVGIGTAFSILDDEPHSLGTGSNVIVGNNGSASPPSPQLPDAGSGSFSNSLNAGNDGLGSFTIAGPADSSGSYTWAYSNTAHDSVTESYNGSPLFSLTLNSSGGIYDGSYTMTMLGTLPDSQLNLDANNIHAAGPTSHLLDVGTIGSTDDVLITGNPGPINASNGNVGVSNGNIDAGETLMFQLYTNINHATLIPFLGINVGTKSAGAATYHVTGVLDSDHSTVVDLGNYDVGKNGTIHVVDNALLDSITVNDVSGNAIKIGIAGISLLLPPADAGFHFTAQLADGDGDHVSSPFNVFIDGNNDGVVDTAHVMFPV